MLPNYLSSVLLFPIIDMFALLDVKTLWLSDLKGQLN